MGAPGRDTMGAPGRGGAGAPARGPGDGPKRGAGKAGPGKGVLGRGGPGKGAPAKGALGKAGLGKAGLGKGGSGRGGAGRGGAGRGGAAKTSFDEAGSAEARLGKAPRGKPVRGKAVPGAGGPGKTWPSKARPSKAGPGRPGPRATAGRDSLAGDAPAGGTRRGPRPSQAAPRLVVPERAGPALVLLHRDEEVLVIDKPAGLAVVPGRRGGPSLEDQLPALQMGKKRPPQPAHRLDQDTAGCLVLGRTKPALAAIGALFADGLAKKTYWAVVRGAPKQDSGVLEAPLLKVSTKAAGWRMVVDPKGQPASTEWRVLGRGGGLAWLELRPRTGRTHQIRAHCAHLGHPILGDARYGGGAGALHLLARAIMLPLDPPVSATAAVPPHMRAAMASCGWGP